MAIPFYNSIAEAILAFASVGTLCAAISALIVAHRQIYTAREMEAMNAYEKYHHLILEYA